MPRRRQQTYFSALTFALFALVIMCMGCAGLERRATQDAAIKVERLAVAGSAALDQAVTTRIFECRARQLETEHERAECMGRLVEITRKTGHAAELLVAALRAFWIASAVDDQAGARRALMDVAAAAAELPPEYFSGVAKAARGLVR